MACSLAGGLFAQQPWFKDKDLTLTGAYYYPEHWDESQWERDFKQMHDWVLNSPISRNLLGRNWNRKREKYDFAWLDKAVALAAKYDLKVIMCTSTATPPVWLSRKYPEILIKNENGTVLDHGARQHASFALLFSYLLVSTFDTYFPELHLEGRFRLPLVVGYLYLLLFVLGAVNQFAKEKIEQDLAMKQANYLDDLKRENTRVEGLYRDLMHVRSNYNFLLNNLRDIERQEIFVLTKKIWLIFMCIEISTALYSCYRFG